MPSPCAGGQERGSEGRGVTQCMARPWLVSPPWSCQDEEGKSICHPAMSATRQRPQTPNDEMLLELERPPGGSLPFPWAHLQRQMPLPGLSSWLCCPPWTVRLCPWNPHPWNPQPCPQCHSAPTNPQTAQGLFVLASPLSSSQTFACAVSPSWDASSTPLKTPSCPVWAAGRGSSWNPPDVDTSLLWALSAVWLWENGFLSGIDLY